MICLNACRSLISRLEEVDPSKLKHEEKLAFWINVHNSLVMHVKISLFFKRISVSFVTLMAVFFTISV